MHMHVGLMHMHMHVRLPPTNTHAAGTTPSLPSTCLFLLLLVLIFSTVHMHVGLMHMHSERLPDAM